MSPRCRATLTLASISRPAGVAPQQHGENTGRSRVRIRLVRASVVLLEFPRRGNSPSSYDILAFVLRHPFCMARTGWRSYHTRASSRSTIQPTARPAKALAAAAHFVCKHKVLQHTTRFDPSRDVDVGRGGLLRVAETLITGRETVLVPRVSVNSE